MQATKRKYTEKKRIKEDKKDGPEKYTMDKRLKKGSWRFPMTMNNRQQDSGSTLRAAAIQWGLGTAALLGPTSDETQFM